MANALVAANLWATSIVYGGVGVYVDKTVILTDPTLGALAATVYTGAGQGTIVRTGHMPMHPTLTTAPSGVWAGDTYFDNNFLNKYITSTWRPIELLYPTAVPVIGAIGNQVGSLVGQTVIVVNQTATPFSSLGTVLWTISGGPTGTYIEGGSNSGCFIVIPVTVTALVGSYTVVVGASNERGSATNQSFALTMPSNQLYTFTTVTFTPGSATGYDGPNISQARAGLTSGTPTPNDWSATYLNMTTNGTQLWTVPATASYTIYTMGASGGRTPSWTGGRGVILQATFALTQGNVLKILVGQGGTGKSDNCNTGAGGGTFVTFSDNTILIIAGGGGGTASVNGMDGVTTTNGGTSSSGTSGGSGGAGGNSEQGPSGAGYSGNGAAAQWGSLGGVNNGIAQSFLNGGQGGSSTQQNPNVLGGFGGGASGHGNCCIGGGGAGGYSGGGGASSCQGGGGGGSYISSSGSAVRTSNGLYNGSSTFNGNSIINLGQYNTQGSASSGTFAPSGSVIITKL